MHHTLMSGSGSAVRWCAALVGTCLSGSISGAAPPGGVASSQPAISSNVSLAVSKDGFKFEPAGEVLLRNAAAPDIVRLPHGDLLAVFEHAGPGGAAGKRTLWATRSRDDGKTWLPPRPIQLEGLPDDADALKLSKPDLVVLPNGLVRLFFSVVEEERPQRKREKQAAYLLTAITKNGLTYRLEERALLECPGVDAARPSAFWAERQMVLLVAGESDGPSGSRSAAMVQQFLSRDGLEFTRPDRSKLAGEVGHVTRIDKRHWRMYITAGDQVRSRISDDAMRWRDEVGTCLAGGTGASVAPLGDKRYLMLYCSTPDAKQQQRELAATKPQADPTGTAQASQSRQENSSPNDRRGWDSFDIDYAADEEARAAIAQPEGWPPMPDFVNPFDYRGWFEQNHLPPADENAYYSYGDLPDRLSEMGSETFQDMLNSGTHTGPPEPWLPSEHPEWEATYQRTLELLPQYRQGSSSPGRFGMPLRWPEDVAEEDRLLVNNTLPGLGGFRRMARAVISQAWRAPDGTVSADGMRDAFGMCLGNARQLSGGITLIERLVGFAERGLVDEHARWALRQNVFATPEEIEATLNLLKEKDVPVTDVTGWIRAEQAWLGEAAQYVFAPGENGKTPRINAERLKKIGAVVQGTTPENVTLTPEILKVTPEQATETLNEIKAYYRYVDHVWQTSYPGPAIENTDKLAQEINQRDPMAGSVLASGHRAYEMMIRAEANRRATQLAYGVELFKSRNGRYPASLDELPAEHAADVRTDPFSGGDFVYRLGDDGPVIYSASNNGRDDGGLHSKNWGDREDGTGSDDYVFWPPQE